MNDEAPSITPGRTLDLPRLVMRRAMVVAVLALLAAGVLGFLRAGSDIDQETRSAIGLAEALSQLRSAATRSDEELRRAIDALQNGGALRHLAVTLRDAQGTVISAPPAAPGAGALAPLVALHAWWQGDAEPHRLVWPIARPDGTQWMLTLTDTRDSERVEAMADLALSLAVLALGAAAMLAVMSAYVRRAFRPLQALLDGIERLERGDPDAMARLPARMPVRELQMVASALRRLDGALQAAEAQRRVLGQKVITLQEDERALLAQELHDEFGQRLTALRVDAAWLQRKLQGQDALVRVVDGMAAQCDRIQQDIRALLARLRPLGAERGEAWVPLGRLGDLLQALVQAWGKGDGRGPGIDLALRQLPAEVDADAPHDTPRAWDDAARARTMPRDLQLAVYRITQEALTNVARHAQAQQVTLSLVLQPLGDGRASLAWSLADDGIGLPDPQAAMQRGNGLAGMRERAWAQGGELQLAATRGPTADGGKPGLRLTARFEFGGGPDAEPAVDAPAAPHPEAAVATAPDALGETAT